MLCHSPIHHSHSTPIFHLHHRPNPNPNPNPSLSPFALHFPPPIPRRPLASSLHSHPSRRQNSLFFSPKEEEEEEEENEEELRKKRIVEEASLATRRIPRFPGSIDFPRPEHLHRPLDLSCVDDRTLKQALEVRRGVAAEALKDALRAGRFSITYSDNLVSRLPDFVDRIVIAAAAMKADPELSHLSFNARAKNYIRNSGIVALVKWLKHNSMTYPQIGKLICKCSGELEQLRHQAEWLKTIHVKGESLGVVLVKANSIVERRLEEMEEIVGYLEGNGVRREWIGFVVSRCPQVLALSMEELVSRVKFYMDMGMSENDFGTMVFDYPRAVGFFSLEEMNSQIP